MAENDKKQKFILVVQIVTVMFVTDLILHAKSNRSDLLGNLCVALLLITLYYLKYRNKLTNFTKAQTITSLVLVIGLALALLAFIFISFS